MEFGRVGSEFLSGLSTILKSDGILVGKDELLHYGHDETEDLSYPPEVVVRPDTTNEVAAVVRLCSQFGIPVTPIGARTGLSGGALCCSTLRSSTWLKRQSLGWNRIYARIRWSLSFPIDSLRHRASTDTSSDTCCVRKFQRLNHARAQ